MSSQAQADSKTEDPTERRVHEALEKGNTPFSKEASICASLFAMLFVGHLVLVPGVARLMSTLTRMLDDHAQWPLANITDALGFLAPVATDTAVFLASVTGTFFLCGLASSLMQNMPAISLERIKPDFSRLSPAVGFKRIFGIGGQVDFAKSALKLLAVTIVVIVSLRSESARLTAATLVDPAAIPSRILGIAMQLVTALAICMGAIAAADMAWSRVKWRRDLRMSKQEVKDEFRQLEGDPQVKARMRSIALERNRRRMIAAVPRATMIIANPTHFAVALRYVREDGGAPIVLAKGQDLIALKIREIAERHGIPIVEDKALARSMYQATGVDQLIPPEFYRAVAALVHLLQTQGPDGLRRRRTAELVPDSEG